MNRDNPKRLLYDRMSAVHQEAIRTDHTINQLIVFVEQCIDILITPGHDFIHDVTYLLSPGHGFKINGGVDSFLMDCSTMIAKLIELFSYRIMLLESLFTYGDMYYAAYHN